MRNRYLLYRKLETLDHTLTYLKNIVNTREPVESYKNGVDKAKTLLNEIQTMIEKEPISPNER